MLPAIATIILVGVGALSTYLLKDPHLRGVNIPVDKERFSRLSGKARARITQRIGNFIDVILVFALVIMLVVQVQTFFCGDGSIYIMVLGGLVIRDFAGGVCRNVDKCFWNSSCI